MVRVKATVYVHVPGGAVVYTPDGPDVAPEHLHLIRAHLLPGEHVLTADELRDATKDSPQPTPDHSAPATAAAEGTDPDSAPVPPGSPSSPGEGPEQEPSPGGSEPTEGHAETTPPLPPRNASRAAWLKYADAIGVLVPGNATRYDIIAALAPAPTDG